MGLGIGLMMSEEEEQPVFGGQPEQGAQGAGDEPRNQYGRTWAEHETHLRNELRPVVDEITLQKEIDREREAFKRYSRARFPAAEAREEHLDLLYLATPLERRPRLLQTAAKLWT
jgi:hypothetical protein